LDGALRHLSFYAIWQISPSFLKFFIKEFYERGVYILFPISLLLETTNPGFFSCHLFTPIFTILAWVGENKVSNTSSEASSQCAFDASSPAFN